jgi:hypothetical protein
MSKSDEMKMRSGGRTSGNALLFHNITGDGFQGHSGGDDPGWKSTCSRRR